MYHALEIQEILWNILGHLYSPTWRGAPALASLASTCRALKDPALDVLWEELYDLSPLVRCLPEASHHSDPSEWVWEGPTYSLTRSPTDTEWATLRSYTRRIRSIQSMDSRVDPQSLRTLLNPPAADLEPLFSNLRHLRCVYTLELEPLSRLLLPSLVSLDLRSTCSHPVRSYFDSLPNLSPNIKRLDIEEAGSGLYEINSKYFCHWKNLQSVRCRRVILGYSILVHLSRMPALTDLTFALGDKFPDSKSPLSFTNLHHLSLHSVSLSSISKLLSWIETPVVTYFCALVDEHPAQEGILPFFTSIRTSKAAHTVKMFSLVQSSSEEMGHRITSDPRVLDLDKLRPSMAFSNIRALFIDLLWNVSLTDADLLALASAWPHLEQLNINEHWGWHTPNGITPNGLRQLLETCPSLSQVALAMDTRGYTEFTPSPESVESGLTVPPTLSVNVLDATIEAECVPAVAAFFATIVPGRRFGLAYWDCYRRREEAKFPLRWDVKQRWDDVYRLAVEMVSSRS